MSFKTLKALGAALFIALALAACTDPVLFPESEVTGVSAVDAQGTFTIDGSNFYQYVDGQGMRIEACGVTFPAAIVDAALSEILLPPAGRITVQVGDRLTATFPTEGLTTGSSDVRVIRPDGQVTVLENAITCVEETTEPEPDPDPEPEPKPDPDPDPDLVPAVAVLEASPTEGQAPLNVWFTAAGSVGEGSLTFAWDLGDGDTDARYRFWHAYTEPGEYTVTLTVTGENGETDTATQTITVTPAPPSGPTARIDFSILNSDRSTALVEFDGSASDDPAGGGLTYAWYELDYMDAGFSSGPTVAPWLYYGETVRVLLTVTDTHGNTDSTALVTLLDAPETVLGEPFDYAADITRTSWSMEGDQTRLELQAVNNLVLPTPGTEPFCLAPASVGPLAGPERDPAALAGFIGLDTDRDPSTGNNYGIPGIRGADYIILLEERRLDGAFPIIDGNEFTEPCSSYAHAVVGWAQAELDYDTVAFTFTTPDDRGLDFDLSAWIYTNGSPFSDFVPDLPPV